MSGVVRSGETIDLFFSIVQLLSLFTPLSNGGGGSAVWARTGRSREIGDLTMTLHPWRQGDIFAIGYRLSAIGYRVVR
jgi:hypothetical protein